MSVPLLPCQLHDFQILENAFIDNKANQRTHFVETILTRRTGVDVEQTERLVVLHLQNMRMTTDKQLGRARQNTPCYRRIVFAGIAANVLHQHFSPLYPKTEGLRIKTTDVLSVNIAIHGTERAESSQTFGHFERTDVARMPDFIACVEILQVFLVPIPVRVGQQTYFYHLFICFCLQSKYICDIYAKEENVIRALTEVSSVP